MTENSSSAIQKIFTEGMMLACLSAYIYLIAFFYETGYCGYFFIPASLIVPNITTILITASTIITTLLYANNYAQIMAPLLHIAHKIIKKDSSERRRPFFDLILLWLLACILVVGCLLFGMPYQGVLILLVLVTLVTILLVAIGLAIKSYEKISRRAVVFKNDPSERYDLVGIVGKIVGQENIGALVLIALIIPLLANPLGGLSAATQESFIFLKTNKNYAVIRNYGDMFLAVRIDSKSKIIYPDFFLKRIPEGQNIELNQQYIGRVEPQKSKFISKTELQRMLDFLKSLFNKPSDGKKTS